jgi:hypothetical protein
MTRAKIIAAILLMLTCATGAWAGFSLPVTFVANTPLLAAQLNSNFSAIAAALTSSGNGYLPIGNSSGTYTSALPTSNGNTITITAGSGTLNADVAPNVIQHATVSLSSTNLLNMYATPVLLVSAPNTGQNIVVQEVMFTMTATSTAYAGGGVVEFQIGNTAHGAGTATTATVAASVVNAGSAGTTYTTVIPVSYTGTAASGLYISNQTGAFTTGTGTAVVDIWYHVQ